MKKAAAAVLALLLILTACGKNNEEPPPTPTPDLTARFDQVYEMRRVDSSPEDFTRYTVYLIAPIDFTKQEAHAHAQMYIEKLRTECEDLFVVSLHYYDNEVFCQYRDSEMFEARWGPRGSWNNTYGVALDDYSTHTLGGSFHNYYPENAFSEEDLKIYAALQAYSVQTTGEPIRAYFTPENFKGDLAVYEYIAEYFSVTTDYLKELRIKAALWRPQDEYA